jgi:glycosyltransferase involved in cell wall biosynthesis
VELGTHGGYSYFSFCQAAKDHSTGTVCHAVDTWQGDEHAGYYCGEHLFSQLQNYNRAHFSAFSVLQRMTFDKAAEMFEASSIDVLHIDGLHTYEAVKHDWETWLPKVRPGGIVLFHDTAVRERDFGVWRLWEELAAKYPSFAFTHSAGLGVLCNGAVPVDNPFLQTLLSGNLTDRIALSSYYENQVPPLMQLYWSGDGCFSEECSQMIACASDDERTQSFTIAAEKGLLHLQFTPMKTPGFAEIATILVKHSAVSKPLLWLRVPSDWNALGLSSDLIKANNAPALTLLSLSSETKIKLPVLEINERGGTIVCKIRLRLRPICPMLVFPLEKLLESRIATEERIAVMDNTIEQIVETASNSKPFDRIRNSARQFRYWIQRRFKLQDFHHSIDSPVAGDAAPRSGYMLGWVFAAASGSLVAVRARQGQCVWPGKFFLYRPDVGRIFSSAGSHSGFSIPYELAGSGAHQIAFEALTHRGQWIQFARCTLTARVTPHHEKVEYSEWLGNSVSEPASKNALVSGPTISVLLPVYNPPEVWLRQAIQSVLLQTYRNWELCIANDASTLPYVRSVLDEYVARDARIKVVHRPSNGHISAASNSALELVTGLFTALFDHDDELAPCALSEVATAIENNPDANLIYSDEDKIDTNGRRYDPYFKPDWQPDLLLGQNFISHLGVYRTEVIRNVGGFRVGYEGSQDWDLALRAIETIPHSSIIHIPRMLYHWRAIPGSAALDIGEKSYAVDAAGRALMDHLARTNLDAELLPARNSQWRVRYCLPTNPPEVSLIIPARDCATLIQTCVESVLAKTTYPSFEVIIVDNGSDASGVPAYCEELRGRGIKVIRDTAPFNLPGLNNRAMQHANGKVLVFLNDGIEVITRGWLEEMVSHAMRPGVGVVGAMLYCSDDKIQHAGVLLGYAGQMIKGGVAGHVMSGFKRGSDGYFNHLNLIKNYTAVTGACMAVRREIFEQIGGFNETDLPEAFYDVDFCLRLHAAGYRNVWTPFAELYNHETDSHGRWANSEKNTGFAQEEFKYMRAKWGPLLDDDPAYNPNLTLVHNDFSLAWPPRPIAAARGASFSMNHYDKA